MNKEFKKNLIPIEIELGFIRIPNGYKKLFPFKPSKIKIFFGKNKKGKELTYNPNHQRIYGLVKFFKLNNLKPRDIVSFEKISEGKFKLFFEKISNKKLLEESLSKEEAGDIIDITEISSQAKGNIVENRIKELILLYGQGVLNTYEPTIDIEGIDIVVLKKKAFQPLFIQVKSRFNLRGKKKNILQIGIKSSSLSPHHTLFIIGAYYNPLKMDIDDYLIFIPSETFVKKANIVNKGTKNNFMF